MDSRKIIIINLSKGRIGDENMKLLGGMLVTKIYLSAMSRADLTDRTMKVMPNFYLYVDEFQNFANASFADILSEARKYKLNLTIAHQYIEQMDEQVRAAVFGNVGTMIIFRVGATDAEILEKEVSPTFTIEDLVNLGFAQIYLKLMIDGLTSSPFSATTLAPIIHPDISHMEEIIAASRRQFAQSRESVEKRIIEFHEPIKKIIPPAVPPTVPPTASPTVSTNMPFKAALSTPVVTQAPIPAHVPPHAKIPDNKPTYIRKTPYHEKIPQPPASKADLSAAISAAVAKGPPVIAKTPEKPAEKPIEKTVEKAPINLISKTPEKEPKPLSLDALKVVERPVDVKMQTEENLGHLKSALAAALRKGQLKEFQLEPQEGMKTSEPDTEEFAPATPVTATSTPIAETRKELPREVPEAVLKNVLKVD